MAEDPTPDLLDELARELATLAATAASPGHSIAMVCRHHLDGVLPPKRVDAIKARARAILDATGTDPRDLATSWITLADVARTYRTRREIIAARLTRWQFRRECGWPRYFLGEWRFAAAAFKGETAASYFAGLPAWEPYPPPDGCEVQPDHPQFTRVRP